MKGLLIIWFLCAGIASSAQIYSTRFGRITVRGRYQEKSVTAVSYLLRVQVNDDRSEIHMRLGVPTMSTNNDSLNARLQQQVGNEAYFDGKMNINHIETHSHPQRRFLTNGTLTINGSIRPFSFTSTLEHFPVGSATCNLSAEFVIDLKEFGILTRPGENKITVGFNQLILKR